MKDNFSSGSENYALYRPTYPVGLFQYLNSLLPQSKFAWDCGTGNGQFAFQLTNFFEKIFATDISQNQLLNANKHPKIIYSLQPAEMTDFPDHHFDLVTVAQAIHWFDFTKFYQEVERVLKKDGLLAVIGYGLLSVSPSVDLVLNHFYSQTLKEFWDPERKYIDEGYKTIPFPLQELVPPNFEILLDWNLDQLIGFLKTWSAVKHFENQKGYNPVDKIVDDLKSVWSGNDFHSVGFPVLLRIGRPM